MPSTTIHYSQRKRITMNDYHEKILNHSKVLYSFAYKLTKSKEDAEDLVQDTILKAILKESNFEKGTNLKAWLCKMMYRLFLDRINSTKNIYNKSRYSFEEIFTIVNYETDENLAISNLNIEDLNKIINTQNKKTAEIFKFYTRGFKYREISTRLNVPMGTVKGEIHKLRKNIIPYLKKQGYDKNSKT